MRYKFIIIFVLSIFVLTGCSKEISDETENISTDIIIRETTTKKTTINEATTEETTIQKSTTEDRNLKGEISISKDSEVAEAMREVLRGERDFISVDEGYELTNINTFDCFDSKSGYNLEVQTFRTVDIDEDGNYEIVLLFFKENGDRYTGYCSELLRYYNGNVYGYNINSSIYILGNGGYMSWHGPYYGPDNDYRGYKGIGRFEFEDDKLTCTYVFETYDTESEKWLRKSGIMNEDEKIVYDSEKYDKIKSEYEKKKNEPSRFLSHTLIEEHIETYVR